MDKKICRRDIIGLRKYIRLNNALTLSSNYHKFRLVISIIAIIGGIIFGVLLLTPFGFQSNLVNSLAADGSVESFTRGFYNATKLCFGPLAILFILTAIFFLGFQRQSESLVEKLLNYIGKFTSMRRREVTGIAKIVSPTKADVVPLLILLGITCAGIFFRYAYLWRPMGHDETYTFMAFASRGFRAVITDYHLPNNHVFHTVLVNVFYQLFGDSPAVIRVPAFIAGILVIPSTYLVGRIFYSSKIGLVGASIVASLPVLIDYSTTARGYPIITFFALLIIALAVYVKDHRNLVAWGGLVLIASLGIYTNPTMIYPIGMAFTWLLFSKLIDDVNQEYERNYYLYLLGSAGTILVLSAILYSPIIYTSGLGSIIGNDVIEALTWSEFTQSILPRIKNTWAEWNRGLPSLISLLALIGLTASFFVPSLPRNRRVPLILSGVIWIGTAVIVQRVAPWPRIWIFLLPFFVIWISAGYIGLFDLIFQKFSRHQILINILVSVLVIAPLILGFTRSYPQYDQKLHAIGAVEEVADFLKDDLKKNDVVVVTSPDTIVLKYYLRRLGVSKEATELTKEKEFDRAIVVVNKGHGQALDYVLDRRSFLDDVNLASSVEIYKSDRFTLYQLEGSQD